MPGDPSTSFRLVRAAPLMIAPFAVLLLMLACRPVDAQQAPSAETPQQAPACPDSDDMTDPISVRVGEAFAVGLRSNQTTGYTWSLDEVSLGGVARLIGSEYLQPRSPQSSGRPPIGAGGKQCFTFEATASGSTTLVLDYRRPSDPASRPSATTKELTVTVSPAAAPVQVPRAAFLDDLPD